MYVGRGHCSKCCFIRATAAATSLHRHPGRRSPPDADARRHEHHHYPTFHQEGAAADKQQHRHHARVFLQLQQAEQAASALAVLHAEADGEEPPAGGELQVVGRLQAVQLWRHQDQGDGQDVVAPAGRCSVVVTATATATNPAETRWCSSSSSSSPPHLPLAVAPHEHEEAQQWQELQEDGLARRHVPCRPFHDQNNPCRRP